MHIAKKTIIIDMLIPFFAFQDLELSPWVTFQLYYDAYQVLWTLLLIFGITARFRSSFVALLWTAFPALGNILKSKLFGKWRGTIRSQHNHQPILFNLFRFKMVAAPYCCGWITVRAMFLFNHERIVFICTDNGTKWCWK